MENDNVELYWELNIHNRPDIILVEEAVRTWKIIAIAVISNFNVVRTEDWKV